MSEQDSVLFKSDKIGAEDESRLPNFSNVPVIRNFESLLSDEDFASAGFKVAPHPTKNTFYLYPSSQLLAGSDRTEHIFNTVTPGRYVVSHSLLCTAPLLAKDAAQVDFAPILERIEELRALSTDEHAPFNERSAEEAVAWVRLATPQRLPNVFLLNNGNTRLVWRDGQKQLGIQFLGDGTAQFVYLGQDDQTERVYGSTKVSEQLTISRSTRKTRPRNI